MIRRSSLHLAHVSAKSSGVAAEYWTPSIGAQMSTAMMSAPSCASRTRGPVPGSGRSVDEPDFSCYPSDIFIFPY